MCENFKLFIVILSAFYCCIEADGDVEDRRCFTPDAQLGTCIEQSECHILANLSSTQKNIDYREISRCKDKNKNNVCCPPGQPRISGVKRLKFTDCPHSAAPPHPPTACCGVDASMDVRIVGGIETSQYAFPWMALLQYELRGQVDYSSICGGSLISTKYVLTAAHCVDKKALEDKHITIRNVTLGEYDTLDCIDGTRLDDDSPCNDGSISIPIETIKIHNDYNNTFTGKDIALIRLKNSVQFNDFIKPICLPTSDITLDEEHHKKRIFDVAGWGINESGGLSDKKLYVKVPYVPRQECAKVWGMALENHICAGGEDGKDSCNGDSGGPLMHYTNGMYSLVGIVSYGYEKCGKRNLPGVYTNVYKFLPWIRSQMKP